MTAITPLAVRKRTGKKRNKKKSWKRSRSHDPEGLQKNQHAAVDGTKSGLEVDTQLWQIVRLARWHFCAARELPGAGQVVFISVFEQHLGCGY